MFLIANEDQEFEIAKQILRERRVRQGNEKKWRGDTGLYESSRVTMCPIELQAA